ncbi:HNH endonuclease family protein [Nonomuraea sp. NPDC005983]|uniref:HNH endonuclease family protein n=1 Tax=Nonomuraea sp. NPDC005983 TaxID=3155595 RepID=UPI0033A37FB6
MSNLLVIALIPYVHVAPPPPALPEPAGLADSRSLLTDLRVGRAGSLKGYRHDRFLPGWGRQYGACDTREIVLKRDGRGVRRDRSCRAVRGVWYSRYDGRKLTSTAQIDVDHLVPLANAWISGANTWNAARRRAFANDLKRPELVAVSEKVNLAKGGHSPANWRPPVRGYWCTYARSWITVKHHYDLRVTPREKKALGNMLRTCR